METLLTNILALGSGVIATAVVVWQCIEQWKENN